LRLGPHCGRRRPDFISISIPLKGFHFPLFIFRCHRHQLCWISAQHLVFRRAGSLLRVFLSVARCSEGAALTWIFAFVCFPGQIGGQAFHSTRSAHPILPLLALVYSSRAQGFGLVPCCVFCRHSSTRFLTGARPRGQSLSLIDFVVHSSVDFLPACLSLFVLRRVFFPCCCTCWSRRISSLPVMSWFVAT
jgi:hypothetical protein